MQSTGRFAVGNSRWLRSLGSRAWTRPTSSAMAPPEQTQGTSSVKAPSNYSKRNEKSKKSKVQSSHTPNHKRQPRAQSKTEDLRIKKYDYATTSGPQRHRIAAWKSRRPKSRMSRNRRLQRLRARTRSPRPKCFTRRAMATKRKTRTRPM